MVTCARDATKSPGNSSGPTDDWMRMDCEGWRESISALADGEEPGVDVRLVDAHLDGCADCRQFRSDLAEPALPRRLHSVGEQRDLSRGITTQVAAADRAAHPPWLRATLGASAAAIIAFGAPALLLGDSHASSSHAARHLGAFTVAYGFGLLAVVFRPAKARGFLPVAAVVAGGLAITAVLDVVKGTAPFIGGLRHGIEVVSVVLVWLLAPRPPRRRAVRSEHDTQRPRIHIVDRQRRAG